MYNQKHLLRIAIVALAFSGLAACEKSSGSSTTSGTGKPFYCKLDGTEYAPTGGGRYYDVSSGSGVQIVGDDANTTIELHLSSAAVGTYTAGGNTTSNFGSVYYASGNKAYVSTDGEIKITKVDGTKISGTFHYTATGTAGTVKVTDGEFNDIPKK